MIHSIPREFRLALRASGVYGGYCPHRRPRTLRAESPGSGASNSAGVERESDMSAPCTNCRRSDVGKLQYVYLATFPNGVRESARLRLCAACYDMAMPDLLSVAEVQDKVGRWLAPEQRAD